MKEKLHRVYINHRPTLNITNTIRETSKQYIMCTEQMENKVWYIFFLPLTISYIDALSKARQATDA